MEHIHTHQKKPKKPQTHHKHHKTGQLYDKVHCFIPEMQHQHAWASREHHVVQWKAVQVLSARVQMLFIRDNPN